MPYKMISIGTGINDPLGVSTRTYTIDEEIPNSPEWVDTVGKNFVRTGQAIEIQGNEPIPMTKSEINDLPSDVEPKVEKQSKKSKHIFSK
tara:strand:- start:506 stop:775 length:270 start_codon:yes stop_codon:yes gene_type:complete